MGSRRAAWLFLLFCIGVAITAIAYRDHRQEEEDRTWWRDVSFKSVVVDRYVVHEQHNAMHTVMKEDSVIGDYLWTGMYHSLAIGDSLLKESGHMEATIKRADGSVRAFSLFSE